MSDDFVSVLLPVHRENPFLATAIQSLIEQDYQQLEILFLDNSRDGIAEEVWKVSTKIRYIKVPGDFGLSETLNVGIKESNGVFILRMDYDDISLPQRISEQVRFMQANPKIGISGTFAVTIGTNIDSNVKPGEIITRPTNSEDINEYLLYKNPLIHPTVIMRKSLITKFELKYNKNFDSAEDLDFWSRASKFFPIGNIPKPLLQYRIHESQYSRIDGVNSRLQSAIIRSRHASRVVFSHHSLRQKAIRALVRNILLIIKLKFIFSTTRKFRKFE